MLNAVTNVRVTWLNLSVVAFVPGLRISVNESAIKERGTRNLLNYEMARGEVLCNLLSYFVRFSLYSIFYRSFKLSNTRKISIKLLAFTKVMTVILCSQGWNEESSSREQLPFWLLIETTSYMSVTC